MTKINTRAELINALTEAAELEHGLLCQYVFAAVTMKQTADEGITWPQAELLRGWKRTLLEVARQEMAHLGTVHNLLTAVGGAPHFMRLNFPQAARHFPADAPFVLEPFGEQALRRFIRFEEPTFPAKRLAAAAPAPDPISYTHVGALYHDIEAGFEALDDGTLFIGPVADQDDNDWSRGLRLWPVHDLRSARKAIDFIVKEGEGAPGQLTGSHYQRFVDAHAALGAATAADPTFEPGRPVAPNPLTRNHPDAPDGGHVITDERTLAVAELFSVSYETTLMMLSQFYAFGPETPVQREALRQATREIMSTVIRPLGEVLTRLPMGPDYPKLNAGPAFELYGDIHVSTHAENAWYVISERLGQHAAAGLALAAKRGAHPRLRLCAENLARLGTSLARAAASGFTSPSPALARKAVAVREDSSALTHPARMATARYGSAALEQQP
jgi:hypothetical protein